MPEATEFTSGAQRFRLSYFGGSGNDITLTALVSPPPMPTPTGPSIKSFTIAPINLFGNDVFEVNISGFAVPGSVLQPQRSQDLKTWVNLGGTVTANATTGAWGLQAFLPRNGTDRRLFLRFFVL
jgi:hypothetical protein